MFQVFFILETQRVYDLGNKFFNEILKCFFDSVILKTRVVLTKVINDYEK